MSSKYRIELIEGDFFPKGEKKALIFYEALFQSFSLLSWLSQASQVKILDEQIFQFQEEKRLKVYTFTAENVYNPKYLIQVEKCQKEKNIDYAMVDSFSRENFETQCKKLEKKIKVTFSMVEEPSKGENQEMKEEKSSSRNAIFIDINDFSNVLGKIGGKNLDKRINLKKNYLKPNELEYYYIEPESQRNKQILNCHFNLAFQGGGAKSISYVGVYKALKELHPHTPITSLIGSSAGGLLALAIGTEMKPEGISELCLRMDTIPADKRYTHESEITPEDAQIYEGYMQKIKCLLHNYGILEGTIFDQLREDLSDLETSDKLLKVLELINPSIAQLLTLELKKKVSKKHWFAPQQYYQKRFNYYGLLQAAVMNGNAYETMAVHCIIDYFGKHFNKNYMKKFPEKESRKQKIIKILEKWEIDPDQDDVQIEEALETEQNLENIKKLTLKQFYDINEVEFTCTAVDLDDKILRLFNHKTSPNLPVCKAVQLSGSFPIAFKSRTWEKQWGKYYIHYSKIRKQIDLTGHTMTDGGLLANFPIKYIDNEDMRPMYFSHCKNPCNTILYGFGLEQIPDKISQQKQKEREEAINDLKEHISSRISKLSLIKNLLFSNSSVVLEHAKLEQIPVLGYLLKLLKTLPISDYNLNLECFRQNIVLTQVEPKGIERTKDVNQQMAKFIEFRKNIEELHCYSSKKKKADPKQLLKATCQRVHKILDEYDTPENTLIEKYRIKILESLYNYQGIRIKYEVPQSSEINLFIRKIEEIYPPQIFKLQETTSVKKQLLHVIDEVFEYFNTLDSEQMIVSEKIVGKMINQQLAIVDKTSSKITQIIDKLEVYKDKHIFINEYNKICTIDSDVVFDLASIESKFFIIDQPYLENIFQHINQINIPGMNIENQIMRKRSVIDFEIREMLKKSQHDKIHLVMESKENSHLYFCSLFEILQNILHEEEYLEKKIDMITCSDFHSIFALLLAGGKKVSNIRKQMWKVKDLISFEKGILEEYDTYRWAKTESQQMKELLQIAWTDHYHVFDQMQQYLNKEGSQELLEEVKVLRTQFLYSKSQITKQMSQILDYVVKSSYQAAKIKNDPELQKKRLAQYLSLKNGKNGKDYKSKNEKISKNTQRLIRMMMVHFEHVLSDMVLNNLLVKDTFEFGLDQPTAEKVWKGMVIKKLLSSKKLEFYIKEKLEEMKLNTNTTLSQFYQFCQRKITLNFSLINKNKERMEMINRYTKPNMPVWAAIIASTSMPFVFPDFTFQEEWEFSPFTDSRMRKLVHYFFDSPKEKTRESFVCGNYVSTLPLELLTNPRMAKESFVHSKEREEDYLTRNKLFQTSGSTNLLNSSTHQKFCSKEDYKELTVITFAFNKIEKRQEFFQIQSRKKKFFSLSNLISLGVDYLFGRFKNIDIGFEGIMRRIQIFKFLSIGIQYHDNTIMKLYYEQSIKLPIGLGTLDFYKIESGRNELLHSCIYQSEFIVRGIFENLKISDEDQTFVYTNKKKTYLQYELFDDKIHLKFISKSKWNRKLATMYKIFWKVQEKDNYVEYNQEQIVVPASLNELYLAFDYPDLNKMIRKTHEVSINFQKLKNIEQPIFFKFDYEELVKRYLLPVPLFSKRLKTRVIPNSKTALSEPRIEDSAIKLYLEPKQIHVEPRLAKKSESIAEKLPLKKEESKQSGEEQIFDTPVNVAYLLVKTKVSFKNNGLQCKGCVKPLTRTENELTSVKNTLQKIEIGECSKCHKSDVILGYKCYNKKCTQKSKNQYCFSCLFVYLIHFDEGICRCSTEDHTLEYFTPENSQQIALCHFCSIAATSYYRDDKCNINMCLKCSLTLETKKMNS